MTRNQIEYQKLVETSRNNQAVEKETNRSNLAREAETNRSNIAREYETNRHNIVGEQQGWTQLAESERAHRASESLGYANVGLGYSNLSEVEQHNRQTEWLNAIHERELNRHNVEQEAQQQAELTQRAYDNVQQRNTQIKTAQIQADTSRYNTNVNSAVQLGATFAKLIQGGMTHGKTTGRR